MKHTIREEVSHAPTTITHALIGLVREMAPVVLFFFVVFGLIGLLYKLFVEQYAIEFSAFSKAAIAALILGKVVLLLDWAETGHRFEKHRLIVVVVVKTLIYAVAVIAVGLGERIFDSMRKAGSLKAGVNALIANANVDRFLGFVLLISLIVGAYLTMQEISRAMGKGALFKLFFDAPTDRSRS